MRAVDRLGFRRALLAQEDREDDQHEDGEELALPVLERFEPEPGGAEILQGRDGLSAVERLLMAVEPRAAGRVESKGDQKEQEQDKADDPFFVSSPTKIAQRIYDLVSGANNEDLLWPYLRDTLLATFGGVVIGTVAGALLGLILSNSRTARGILGPYITLINAMPRVALVPIFVIVAGPTMSASILTSVTVVLFLVFYNSYNGGLSVPKQVIENAQLLGATPFQLMRQVRLPYVLVWTFASLPTRSASDWWRW